MRLRLDVAYDGAGFSGWAAQPGRSTVQGELEAAVATVLRVPSVALTCAGRTDSGVHARGQVCHVDVDDTTSPGDLRRRLAGVLPTDVRVRGVEPAEPGFDARFSAVWRRYAYRVCDDTAALDPLRRGHVLAWPRPLDLTTMNDAAARLVGEHDLFVRAVRHAHDVHVAELRPAFAPVGVRHDVMASHLAAGFDLTAGGHGPVTV